MKECGCSLMVSFDKKAGRQVFTCMRGFVNHFLSDAEDDTNDCRYLEKRGSGDEICGAVKIFKKEKQEYDFTSARNHRKSITLIAPKKSELAEFSASFKIAVDKIFGSSNYSIKDLCMLYVENLFEEFEYNETETLGILESEINNIIDYHNKRKSIDEKREDKTPEQQLNDLMLGSNDDFLNLLPKDEDVIIQDFEKEIKTDPLVFEDIKIPNMDDSLETTTVEDNIFANLMP